MTKTDTNILKVVMNTFRLQHPATISISPLESDDKNPEHNIRYREQFYCQYNIANQVSQVSTRLLKPTTNLL